MIYSIILEDHNKVSNTLDYLEKHGDFLINNNNIIFHTKYSKIKVVKDFKKLFDKDFQIIVKQLDNTDILKCPQIVLKWYAQDVATLEQEQVEKYKQEALSILNEVVEAISKQKVGDEDCQMK